MAAALALQGFELRSGGVRKTRPFGGSAGSPTFGAGPGLEPGGGFPLYIRKKKQPALFGQDGLVRVGHCGFVKEVHAP